MLLLLNNYGYCNAIVLLYDFKTPPGVGNNIGMTRHCFYYINKKGRNFKVGFYNFSLSAAQCTPSLYSCLDPPVICSTAVGGGRGH